MVRQGQPLLQKIWELYEQISSLDTLKPSKNVDCLFTQLVLTCTHPTTDLEVTKLSQKAQEMRSKLIRLCSEAEALLETHFSAILASFKNPIENLNIFPYYSNYLKLSLLEFNILKTHCSHAPSTIAFVGSGPLPLSSIILASNHLKSTIFHNFDVDPSANSMASNLVSRHHDLSMRMIFHTADIMSVTSGLNQYNVVFLAALVGLEKAEKVQILKHLAKYMAVGAYLMLRSAHGARAFLYPVVDVCDLDGFEVLCVVHPTDEVINSVIIARKVGEHEKNLMEEEEGGNVEPCSRLASKCSGFQAFNPMIEEFAMEEQRS